MESATFRKWLRDRGCRFEVQARAKGTKPAITAVTVHRGRRKADLPLVGSRKRIANDMVYKVVDKLGLDRAELPGARSRA